MAQCRKYYLFYLSDVAAVAVMKLFSKLFQSPFSPTLDIQPFPTEESMLTQLKILSYGKNPSTAATTCYSKGAGM